jgi:hypothetical protein
MRATPAKEDPMDTTQTETTETKSTTKPAKKGKAKRDPKPKKAVTAKPAKAKREPKPNENLVVFALRMTEAERTKLHETAGPRGATRMARQVLVAAAGEDPAAFNAALDEARRARA